jgi:hypothetical protein
MYIKHQMSIVSKASNFKGRRPFVLFMTELKSKSVQTQLNSIYYI